VLGNLAASVVEAVRCLCFARLFKPCSLYEAMRAFGAHERIDLRRFPALGEHGHYFFCGSWNIALPVAQPPGVLPDRILCMAPTYH
jgi:hypothetical protein